MTHIQTRLPLTARYYLAASLWKSRRKPTISEMVSPPPFSADPHQHHKLLNSWIGTTVGDQSRNVRYCVYVVFNFYFYFEFFSKFALHREQGLCHKVRGHWRLVFRDSGREVTNTVPRLCRIEFFQPGTSYILSVLFPMAGSVVLTDQRHVRHSRTSGIPQAPASSRPRLGLIYISSACRHLRCLGLTGRS